MRADRQGLTLLEVLVALAILGLGAAAWIGLAAQGMHTQDRVTARADAIQRASFVMARLSLEPRDRLAAMGGLGLLEGFEVRVLPLSESLFQVSLADSAGGAELLRTAFHFPDGRVAR